MKKNVFFILFLCVAIAVSAQTGMKPKGSAGIGLFFADDFNGSINGQNRNFYNIGIFAYGDFIYAELICGLFFGGGTENFRFFGADLGIYGKYPFVISQGLSLFPLVGFEFLPVLYAKYNNMDFIEFFNGGISGERHIDWKQFWFKAGCGLDCKLNQLFILRFEALYGIRLRNNSSNELANNTKLMINKSLGHGLSLRISMGI